MINSDDVYKLIGQKIKKARKKKHITQVSLGLKIYMSNESIVGYELGRRHPNIVTLINISKALNISYYELLPTEEEIKELEKNWGGVNRAVISHILLEWR